MSRFEDHLWTEFVREHGDAMARLSRPPVRHAHRAPRLVAGTGLGVAGIGVALLVVLGGTSPTPAFAVTRNRDGTVTISIRRYSGIAGANARLHQLGIRANVMSQAPAGCQPTVSIPMHHGAPPARVHGAPGSATETARAQWRIDPSKVRRDHHLVLTPPPAGNFGGNSAPGGQVWSCGTEGRGNGHSGPPPPPPAGNYSNSAGS